MATNPYNLSDADCARACQIIDDKIELNLTNWEAEFIGNNLLRNRFSERQKEVIANIIDKYNVKL